MSGEHEIVRRAQTGAADRQRVLDELCREVLGHFVGRPATAVVIAQAEGEMRAALDDAIRKGKYVLPDGLVLGRVEIGRDMRLKVFFDKVRSRIGAVAEEVEDGG